jgi:predicted nucleotidyltransferase component of viral defense system
MIRTSRQLKDLVRNMSKSDSVKAQIIIRNYVMERFLERISLSEHKDNLILKGGTLISAVVGLDNRSTMDLDTTIKNLPLSIESAREIVKKIITVEIDDGMTFEIKDIESIMEESDYSGIRVIMEARLETMRTPLKIDFSTGDVITPREIEYSFKLLFEDRSISVWAYNLETVLAEKIETLLTRGTANTRMRDFYDIYALETTQMGNIDESVLCEAFKNTCHKRNSSDIVGDAELILSEVEKSAVMTGLWKNYQAKFDYATDITWERVMKSVRALCSSI